MASAYRRTFFIHIIRDAAGKTARFSAFPIGDPDGAELSAAAPPTVVAP